MGPEQVGNMWCLGTGHMGAGVSMFTGTVLFALCKLRRAVIRWWGHLPVLPSLSLASKGERGLTGLPCSLEVRPLAAMPFGQFLETQDITSHGLSCGIFVGEALVPVRNP